MNNINDRLSRKMFVLKLVNLVMQKLKTLSISSQSVFNLVKIQNP